MSKFIIFIQLICISFVSIECQRKTETVTHFNWISSVLNQRLADDFYRLDALQIISADKNKTKDFTAIDHKCVDQLRLVASLLNTGALWTHKVLDAWGKVPAGLLEGRITDFGHYEECIGIHHVIAEATQNTFDGKYCFASIPLDGYISDMVSKLAPNSSDGAQNLDWATISNAIKAIRIGICIPSVCRPELVDVVLRDTLARKGIRVKPTTPVVESYTCKVKRREPFRTVDKIAFAVFGFFALLVTLSSLYELIFIYNKKNPIKLLISFSIVSNSKKLFGIQKGSNSNVIECLHGIRAISIIWVVIGHQFFLTTYTPALNPVAQTLWTQSIFSLIVINSALAVDTFLLMSGLVVTWVGLRTMDKTDGKLKIWKMYLHRYVRLTPILAALVLFTVSMQRYLADGPLEGLAHVENLCLMNWWSTLLFIHNYAAQGAMCFGHSWYLAVDFQLFILSPFILMAMRKWGKMVFLPFAIAIASSLAYVFAQWFTHEYHFFIIETTEIDATKEANTYYVTHARLSPYLIGMILGYILHHGRDGKISINSFVKWLGWFCCAIVIASIILGPYHRSRNLPTSGMTKWETSILEPFGRFAWTIALAWIIFACHSGFGGIVNKILAFGSWQPLSRMTYAMYLTHFTVQMIVYANYQSEQYFSNAHTIFVFYSCFVITVSASIVAILTFEIPITNVETWLFGLFETPSVKEPQTFTLHSDEQGEGASKRGEEAA